MFQNSDLQTDNIFSPMLSGTLENIKLSGQFSQQQSQFYQQQQQLNNDQNTFTPQIHQNNSKKDSNPTIQFSVFQNNDAMSEKADNEAQNPLEQDEIFNNDLISTADNNQPQEQYLNFWNQKQQEELKSSIQLMQQDKNFLSINNLSQNLNLSGGQSWQGQNSLQQHLQNNKVSTHSFGSLINNQLQQQNGQNQQISSNNLSQNQVFEIFEPLSKFKTSQELGSSNNMFPSFQPNNNNNFQYNTTLNNNNSNNNLQQYNGLNSNNNNQGAQLASLSGFSIQQNQLQMSQQTMQLEPNVKYEINNNNNSLNNDTQNPFFTKQDFQAELDKLRQYQQKKQLEQIQNNQQVMFPSFNPLNLNAANTKSPYFNIKTEDAITTDKLEQEIENMTLQSSSVLQLPSMSQNQKKIKKVKLNYKNQLASSETKNIPATVGNVLLNKLKEKFPQNEQINKTNKIKNIQDLKLLFSINKDVQMLSLKFLQAGPMVAYVASSTRIKQKRLIIKYLDIIIQGCIDPENLGCFKQYESL